MDEYSVAIEAEGPDPSVDVDATSLGLFLDKMGSMSPAASGGPGSWGAQVTVAAHSPLAAARAALEVVNDAARCVGLPDWPVVRVEAVRADALARDLARPNIPELVSPVEAAEILGVSRQRVHQLAHSHYRFPRAFLELGSGPVYLADAIRSFGETWDRRPGRPKGWSPRPRDPDPTAVAVAVSLPAAKRARSQRGEVTKAAKAARAAGS
ncbi:MAG: hypothetical protein ACYCO3_14575 [Mycobacteriales bacterium]